MSREESGTGTSVLTRRHRGEGKTEKGQCEEEAREGPRRGKNEREKTVTRTTPTSWKRNKEREGMVTMPLRETGPRRQTPKTRDRYPLTLRRNHSQDCFGHQASISDIK